MRRFLALILAVLLFVLFAGCEQEIDPALLAALSDTVQTNSEYAESGAADNVLVIDKHSQYFGMLSEYFGLVSADSGDFYACELGYIPAESLMPSHLHFECMKNDEYIDPLSLMK